jgi:hypothetical protein
VTHLPNSESGRCSRWCNGCNALTHYTMLVLMDEHDHHWTEQSAHFASTGRVRYLRCPCGAWLVVEEELVAAGNHAVDAALHGVAHRPFPTVPARNGVME